MPSGHITLHTHTRLPLVARCFASCVWPALRRLPTTACCHATTLGSGLTTQFSPPPGPTFLLPVCLPALVYRLCCPCCTPTLPVLSYTCPAPAGYYTVLPPNTRRLPHMIELALVLLAPVYWTPSHFPCASTCLPFVHAPYLPHPPFNVPTPRFGWFVLTCLPTRPTHMVVPRYYLMPPTPTYRFRHLHDYQRTRLAPHPPHSTAHGYLRCPPPPHYSSGRSVTLHALAWFCGHLPPLLCQPQFTNASSYVPSCGFCYHWPTHYTRTTHTARFIGLHTGPSLYALLPGHDTRLRAL